MRTKSKKPTSRRAPRASAPSRGSTRSGRAARAKAPAKLRLVKDEPPEPAQTVVEDPAPSTSTPEIAFAERVLPVEPERPLPTARTAIFFDVENTSRAEHIARVIDHVAVDRSGRRTDLIAVGNWKVVGQDTARLLARHGAQLVHSAPSVGVRDWSDLRIAVSAGVWLASARPGDSLEIVSDDRAFDAVGDVAASLGIAFRRTSYRRITGVTTHEPLRHEPVRHEPHRLEPVRHEPGSPEGARGRDRRRGRRRGHVGPHATAVGPAAPPVSHLPEAPVSANGGEPHTAPHDEIVGIVRDLVRTSGGATIDSLANALKARGFRRTPGSPRLITRLRRIRELEVSRSGVITLLEPGTTPEPERRVQVEAETVPVAAVASAPSSHADTESDRAPQTPDASSEPETTGAAPEAPARRRRSRRGGRRRRHVGATATTPV